jgi:Na+/proline symporter
LKIRDLALIVAAGGLAIAPAATASAQLRASAPLLAASALQDVDDEDDDGGSTAVWLGRVLIVVLGCIVVCGRGDTQPASP